MFLKLFLTFLEIGAVSFGGGYGMISLIREKVLLNGWLSEAEFLSFIAVFPCNDVFKNAVDHLHIGRILGQGSHIGDTGIWLFADDVG